jgi:hypothetical protein
VIVGKSPLAVPAAPENLGSWQANVLPLAGLVIVTAGALALIRKVLGLLTAVFPALSDCCAWAVYVPSANGWDGATDQPAPDAVVVSVSTGTPERLEPRNRLIVIVGKSPLAVPAVPENVGLLLFVAVPVAGLVNPTAGGTVSTVQDASAGVGSTLPDRLIVRTEKVCGPSTSAVKV